MYEATLLPPEIAAPEQLTRAVANDAVLYVTAATQQLRSLAALVALGSEIVLTGWSVTRTLAEHCGRAAWLLSPDVTPTGRVARFYMERIVSIHMARLAAEKIGERGYAKELKREREVILAQARQVFPDIDLFTVEKLNDWEVGGEPYAGLSKVLNLFGESHLDANGLYDTLSSFTHPSLHRLRAQTQIKQLDDRVHHAFVAEPDVIHWQLATASMCVYGAAQHAVGYLDIDPALLEEWADRHPRLLKWARETEEAAEQTTED
ncbi:hypothetical protein [Aeromicrobium piscarium]|uniref:Uncharacterized protein n=1 Tax=Aeromicrobium piscarium TaxID=2590901 RepID=A0A554RVT4_9ACTN|nr:hypothetical protein [Aeromicrobium piscarium]TSD58155.1 hypothetical protein FNM00_14700 [Aeromicrobium piscarium]